MRKLQLFAVVIVGVLLFGVAAAQANLSIFAAEQAASRYAKQHCNSASCSVGECRRLSRSRVDCTVDVWEVYPENQECEYTAHVSRYGRGNPSVWKGPTYCE